MKKLIILALVVAVVVMFSIPGALFADGYEFPSTNEENKNGENSARPGVIGPHVNLVNAGIGEVTLEFVNPEPYLAGFEYRSDGNTNQAVGSNHFNPCLNDNLYPYIVLGGNETTEMTIAAKEYVEVRLTFGGERDWDFDWTAFYSEKAVITAIQKFGGNINPSGDILVPGGDSLTFTISATPHTYISDVKVDGVSVGAVTSHTFSNVDSNHTIEPFYEPTEGAKAAANWAAGVGVAGITEGIEVLGVTEAGDSADFITLMYNNILDREPDAEGLQNWVDALEAGMTGKDIATAFIFSDECQDNISGYSNMEYVTFLYNALFDRAADSEGLDSWVNAISDGMSWMEVAEHFCESSEWAELCESYSVEPY
ncbi:MAG: DUF4214 domain-containing protein [Actinomycetota bacterium]